MLALLWFLNYSKENVGLWLNKEHNYCTAIKIMLFKEIEWWLWDTFIMVVKNEGCLENIIRGWIKIILDFCNCCCGFPVVLCQPWYIVTTISYPRITMEITFLSVGELYPRFSKRWEQVKFSKDKTVCYIKKSMNLMFFKSNLLKFTIFF